MSKLTVYPQSDPQQVILETQDAELIQQQLQPVGIRFERWQADHALSAEAEAGNDNESVLAAYKTQIDRLVAEQGFLSCDVVSMNPTHPQKTEFRNKFLAEHTHSEDEVRFFVRGSGLFVMHIGEKVYALLCEKNDLISVPANTPHWFDMGPNPQFTAIRLFNNADGWVANFTGDDIARRFPLLDN